MSWHARPTTRPASRSFPNGRGWECIGCGYTEGEFDRPDENTCPVDGHLLTRVVADFNVVREAI